MKFQEFDAKERNHKIINSQRCAGYLMFHGCRLIRMEISHIDPRFNIFVFYDDAKVSRWLAQFTKEEESKANAKRKEIHNRDNRERVPKLEQ